MSCALKAYGKTFLNGASVGKNCRSRVSLQRCRKADGKRKHKVQWWEREMKERQRESRRLWHKDCWTARARGREYHQDGCYGSSGIHIACRGNYVKSSVFSKCKCKSRHGASFPHIRCVLISQVFSRCIYEFTAAQKF